MHKYKYSDKEKERILDVNWHCSLRSFFFFFCTEHTEAANFSYFFVIQFQIQIKTSFALYKRNIVIDITVNENLKLNRKLSDSVSIHFEMPTFVDLIRKTISNSIDSIHCVCACNLFANWLVCIIHIQYGTSDFTWIFLHTFTFSTNLLSKNCAISIWIFFFLFVFLMKWMHSYAPAIRYEKDWINRKYNFTFPWTLW